MLLTPNGLSSMITPSSTVAPARTELPALPLPSLIRLPAQDMGLGLIGQHIASCSKHPPVLDPPEAGASPCSGREVYLLQLL
jgi:hypothetical protein